MLDVECFSYINRALEQEFSPIIVFATNKGQSKIRGSDDADGNVSPHGLPHDLLDRLLIVHTEKYSDQEVFEILSIQCSRRRN
eukprot:UN00143